MSNYIVAVKRVHNYEVVVDAKDEYEARDKVRNFDWIADDFDEFEVSAHWEFEFGVPANE